MKYLIVAADDFGLTKNISSGMAKARREGIVTSLNLLPTGPSFEESLYLIKELKLEEIGAHLALTETMPVTDPAKIPTLIGKDGNFHQNYIRFFMNLFLGKIDPGQVRQELAGQLDRLKRTGIPITNLTSHEHIHMMPAMAEIFADLAKEYSIPFIRYPRRDRLVKPLRAGKFLKIGILSAFKRGMGKIFREKGLRTTDHFIGLLDSGNLDEAVLLELLGGIEEGVTELVCHPGFLSPELLERCAFHLKCEGELSALTSKRVRKFIEERGITLTTYGKIDDLVSTAWNIRQAG